MMSFNEKKNMLSTSVVTTVLDLVPRGTGRGAGAYNTPNIHSAPKEPFGPPNMKNPRANLFIAPAVARKPSDRSVYSNCLNTLQMAVQSLALALKH